MPPATRRARGVSRARETREPRARNASNANECECEIARVASRRVARTVTKPSSSSAPSSRGAPSRDARAPMRAPRARMRRASVARVVALALLARCARAFSGGAGACAHASVGHGTRATPRAREDVVVRVGRVARGTTVAVEIRARAPFRGFLLRATRAASGEALGAFDARAMPRGTRVKSDCGSNAFATHDGSTDATTSVVVPWMAPDDAFDAVRFEATVVEDYNTWYAVERDVACGQGGDVDADANARLDEAREANASDGARAPSVDAALAGGWRAPRTDDGVDARAETARARRLGVARLAHGSLMGFAWLILSPGASFAARYGRKFDPWWFRFHRAAQCAAVALSVVAAYVIIAARGWSKPWGAHGRYGAMVVGLAIAQAYAGYVRKSLPRADFRKWHRAIGIVTTVIATYNCITGASMLARLESSDATSAGAPRLVCLCVFATTVCGALCESQRRSAVHRLMGKSSKSMV
jgi:hypothetical protein